MEKWNLCSELLPQEGQTVLCEHTGSVYTATRFGDLFIPMPFASSWCSLNLCKPTRWSKIDFPEGLTGKYKIKLDITDVTDVVVNFSELKDISEKLYNHICSHMQNMISNTELEMTMHKKQINHAGNLET